MKGKIVGFETVNYVSKKGEKIEGVRLYLNVNSNEVIGQKVGEEFIRAGSSVYNVLAPYLSGDIDALIGADVFIDYNVETRGANTFKSIADLAVTPAASKKGA